MMSRLDRDKIAVDLKFSAAALITIFIFVVIAGLSVVYWQESLGVTDRLPDSVITFVDWVFVFYILYFVGSRVYNRYTVGESDDEAADSE